MQFQAVELLLRILAYPCPMIDSRMLVFARLKYLFWRTGVGCIRVGGRIHILRRARVDPIMRDDFYGKYFREPRSNALRERFKITDEITFFDEFEERPKFLLR